MTRLQSGTVEAIAHVVDAVRPTLDGGATIDALRDDQ